jgi:hypothetical protein
MNPLVGWSLAVIGTAIGYARFGWPGVALCASAIVFWLLLQFNAALRAMRAAAAAPVGTVPSAVMLHAKLKKGMRLLQVIQLTRSLGEKLADSPETYRWCDASGAAVRLSFERGRCSGWTLQRPASADEAPAA